MLATVRQRIAKPFVADYRGDAVRGSLASFLGPRLLHHDRDFNLERSDPILPGGHADGDGGVAKISVIGNPHGARE
jgi:hypothetical protein